MLGFISCSKSEIYCDKSIGQVGKKYYDEPKKVTVLIDREKSRPVSHFGVKERFYFRNSLFVFEIFFFYSSADKLCYLMRVPLWLS